jgi:hypothetical protein
MASKPPAERLRAHSHDALGSGRCEVQQVRVMKRGRTKDLRRRRETLFDALPLDPRDPDIVRAKQVQREGMRA